MEQQERRLEIIQAVGKGELSVEEGDRQLESLETQMQSVYLPGDEPHGTSEMPVGEARDLERLTNADQGEDDHRFNRFKNWWFLPFGIGVVLVVLGGLWMAAGYRNSGLGWGFWLSWIPLSLGLLIMILGWNSQRMVWLHLRIRQKPGERPHKIAFSFPLPIRLAVGILKLASPFMPEEIRMKYALDGLQEMAKKISSSEPLQVFVNDEDGEQMEVYIG